MPYRTLTIPAILLIFLFAVGWSFFYGPAARTYAAPERTMVVGSAAELEEAWRSSGVHGRIAVIVTRHLFPQGPGSGFPETDYLERAMLQGVVREAFYVVPDRVWSNVLLENIAGGDYIVRPKQTETGYRILHQGGRINLMPLSKFLPVPEESLVVIEPGAWTPDERSRMEHLFRLRLLTSDLRASIAFRN